MSEMHNLADGEAITVPESKGADFKYLQNASGTGGYCLKQQFGFALIMAHSRENQFEIGDFQYSRLVVDPIKKQVSYGISRISKPQNSSQVEHTHLTLTPVFGQHNNMEMLVFAASRTEKTNIHPQKGADGKDTSLYKDVPKVYYSATAGGDIRTVEAEFGAALDLVVQKIAANRASVTKA